MNHIYKHHAWLIKTGNNNNPLSFRNFLISSTTFSPQALSYALSLFRHTPSPHTSSWNIIIRAHAHSSPSTALSLFSHMRSHGIPLDHFTFPFVLKACARLKIGTHIHSLILKLGFDSDLFVQNSLISFHGCCGSVEDAVKVFDEMPERDLVSWGSMMGCFVNNGLGYEGLALFRRMQLVENVVPDEVMILSLLTAVWSLGALELGRWVHAFVRRSGFELTVRLGTALIEMYSRCGSIDASKRVFDEMPVRNVLTWSALINGLAVNGRSVEALQVFYNMKKSGLQPDYITFTGVLVACSHGGLLEDGWRVFESLRNEYRMEPKIEHYGCMVDLLGRAGCLYEAYEFVNKMPIRPSPIIWRTLLGACVNHKNLVLAERVRQRICELDPCHDGDYILLSNAYGETGKWVEKEGVLSLMREKRINKTPGYSSVTVGSETYKFVAGDDSHPQSEDIREFLVSTIDKLRIYGYNPGITSVLFDVEEEEKAYSLSYHSEKLAVAFALLNFEDRTIRVMKNLRICHDCHSFMKHVSNVFDREIVVRDRSRFHHFSKGSCSCSDYW